MRSPGLRPTAVANQPDRRVSPRALWIVIALLLAISAVARFGRYRGEREELVARVAPLLAASEGSAATTDRLRREPDPEQARVLAARALVRQVLTQSETLGRPDRLDRLDLARQLAAGTLAHRPANWGASTLLGASTYLGWSIARDNRLLMSAPAWEAPLWRATVLGPSKSEPASFLSMAYLELWPTLPESKREEARELLRLGFEDRETFERLNGVWLATVDRIEDGLDLVPPEPYAWRQTRYLLEQQRNWRGYALATERWHEVMAADFRDGIEEVEARLAAGDGLGARDRLLEILREMPVDRRYAATFSRVMELLPAGLPDSLTARIMERWLAWARTQSRVSAFPIAPEVIDRLAYAAEPGGGSANESVGAEARLALEAETAILAGQLDRAERAERGSDSGEGPEWDPYFLAKSRLLMERGQFDLARAALEEVHPSTQGTVGFWLARLRIEQAVQDETAVAWATARLETLRARRWPAAAWQRRFTLSRLELFTPEANGLDLSLEAVQLPGLGVAVRWDGQEVAILGADAEAPLRVPLEIQPGHHLLELEALGGAEVTPGEVRLIRSENSGNAR